MSGWRWAGLAVAALLLLPLAALGVLAARFDPASLLPVLQSAVRDATGRELRVEGGIRMVWAWRPKIEAVRVTLSNIPGGSRPAMARADSIAVQIALPALLARRIEVTRLDLVGPDILFETVGDAPNWRFDLPDGNASPTTTPWSLSIQGATVRNGMVTWRLPARTKVLGIRDMTVRHGSAGGPIEWDGTYVYSDNAPFRLSGSALPTAGVAGPWTTRLDLAAFDTQASATGTMDTAGVYDLQVEATAGQLERLNALLPEMRLPALRRVVLSTRIGNGRRPGDFPVIGATALRFDAMAASPRFPALLLGATALTLDKPGGNAALHTGGRYAGQGFSLAGTVGVPQRPDEAKTLALDLAVKAVAPGPARFDATIKGNALLDRLDYAGLDAQLHLAAPALATMRDLVAPGLPALTEVRFDGRVKLPDGAGPIAFSAARLLSHQGDLSGSGTLEPAVPAVSGSFRSTRLDLDAALTAFGADLAPPGERPRRGATVIPDTELAWFLLRGPRLDLDLAVADLVFLREDWRGVELGLAVADGRMTRGTLAVSTAGGPVRVALTADSRAAAPPVTLAVDAPGLPLSLLARYAGLPGPVTGTARVVARLRAEGRTLHALAATLSGTASVASVGGRMTNAALVELVGPALTALGITVPAAGETQLRCLGAVARFAAGVGQVAPVALESTYLSLAGEGTVDVGRETLDFDLKPLASVSGSMVTVPVKVAGRFGNVAGRLDANLVDKLGLFIDGLFGSDRATACADAGLVPRAQ